MSHLSLTVCPQYLLPAVTSTAVNMRSSQVKFSISGPYTPEMCLSATMRFIDSSPFITAYTAQCNDVPIDTLDHTFPIVPLKFLLNLWSSLRVSCIVVSICFSSAHNCLHTIDNTCVLSIETCLLSLVYKLFMSLFELTVFFWHPIQIHLPLF